MRSILCLILLSISTSALADKVYIRDVIYVPLRGGQSNEHRILHQGIRSGTVLERLEQNDETGFSRVITPDGLEGWIQNQYLVTEPIARDRLADLQAQYESLQADYQATVQSLDVESVAAKTAADEIARLSTVRDELNAELARITALAADVIEINDRNQTLRTEVSALNQQIDDLVVVNANLKDDVTQTWFMIGIGTILLGILMGFWIARLMFTRRDTGWS